MLKLFSGLVHFGYIPILYLVLVRFVQAFFGGQIHRLVVLSPFSCGCYKDLGDNKFSTWYQFVVPPVMGNKNSGSFEWSLELLEISALQVGGNAQLNFLFWACCYSFFFFFNSFYIQLFCPIWIFFHGKFRLLFLGKASSDRVALLDLWCTLSV